jgi:hypothetical protein
MIITTQSGGTVDLAVSKSSIIGTRLILHIDQTLNIKNGEGDAAIALTLEECKDLIAGLNEFTRLIDGHDHVFTSDSVANLLAIPEVQALLTKLEESGTINPFKKDPSFIKLMR